MRGGKSSFLGLGHFVRKISDFKTTEYEPTAVVLPVLLLRLGPACAGANYPQFNLTCRMRFLNNRGRPLMNTFWGLMGYLPLLLYGLLLYWLLVIVPRWFKAKLKGSTAHGEQGKSVSPESAPEPSQRRRNLSAILAQEDGYSDLLSPIRTEPARSGNGIHIGGSVSAPSAVSENVSVILRRQIPPNLDEPSRSWLGGLPCMPEEIEWPRSVSSEYPDKGERPLHFLAQICCADLPKELWGGLGPREGWLLLFIDPNQGCPEGNDAFRVIHIPQVGLERAPPFDLGPVHDGVYTGPDYRYLLPGEQVPNIWRRWPIDTVSVPNDARHVEGRVLVAPDDFASHLYPGQQIAPERDRPSPIRPLTYGQALYALHNQRAGLERSLPPIQLSPVFCSELHKEGIIREICEHGERQAQKAQEDRQALLARVQSGDESDRLTEQLKWNSARIDHAERQTAWLQEMGDADAIIRYLEESPALEAAWQDGLRTKVDALIEAVRKHDPEAPLSQQDWDELVAVFENRDFVRWQNDRIREAVDQPTIRFREHRRGSRLNPPIAMREFMADMYVDPARRTLIPDDALPAYEANWRQLYSNRPHRMGGYHDGLQSDAVPGPAKDLLLFQIASDDAMHWCWGDAGAYYFWIKPKHLAAGDFSGVEMWLECH